MSFPDNPELISNEALFAFAAMSVDTGLPKQLDGPRAEANYETWAQIGRAAGRMALGDPHAERDLQASLAAQAENRRLNEEVKALFYASNYDSMTGLENRRYFEENLRKRIEQAIRDDEPAGSFAVIALDLDGFKDVNDTYGHPKGDDVLTVVGTAIAGSLRRTDRAARIRGKSVTEGPEQPLADDGDTEQLHISRRGGDEFLALVETNKPPRRGHHELSPGRQAVLAGHRIRNSIEEGAQSEELDIDVFVSTSVGIALWRPGLTVASMLTEADIALYGSKAHKLSPKKPIVVMGAHGRTKQHSTKRYPDRSHLTSTR
jgi:GGDEF domain-containing protein